MNRSLHPVVDPQGKLAAEGVLSRVSDDGSLLSAARKTPMPFWELFVRILPAKPVAALAAAYWYLTKRRVRARNRLAQVVPLLRDAYAIWMREAETGEMLADLARTRPQQWAHRPRFLVLITGDAQSGEATESTVRSLAEQLYPHWTVDVLCATAEQPLAMPTDDRTVAREPGERAGFALGDGEYDYVVLLRGGETLASAALLRMAEAGQSADLPIVIYGDHDELAPDGRRVNPWFKPRWNHEMFLALDYLSPAAAIHMNVAGPLLAGATRRRPPDRDDILLAAARVAGDRVLHIPHILAHVPIGSVAPTSESRRLAVHAQLQSDADVEPGPFHTVKVNWPLPAALPLVSIIVPTRDKLELIKPCVETLLQRTSYRAFELLVVDNRSSEPDTLSYLARLNGHPQVRVLDYDRDYNFSAINNFAAAQAEGSHICMLNNDTEVIDGNWLTELMRYAVRPDIGAVGAKLLYPDRKIQHAGVVVGLGGAAGHAHRFDAADEPGYFRQAHVAQFVTAVTAACLVVEKDKFFAVEGLDEEGFAVAFNDVDFCLKVQGKGWRNVYTPHAVLMHHESKSRGKDYAPANIGRFSQELALLQRRWGTETYEDPAHNPNLDRRSERFVIDL